MINPIRKQRKNMIFLFGCFSSCFLSGTLRLDLIVNFRAFLPYPNECEEELKVSRDKQVMLRGTASFGEAWLSS